MVDSFLIGAVLMVGAISICFRYCRHENNYQMANENTELNQAENGDCQRNNIHQDQQEKQQIEQMRENLKIIKRQCENMTKLRKQIEQNKNSYKKESEI